MKTNENTQKENNVIKTVWPNVKQKFEGQWQGSFSNKNNLKTQINYYEQKIFRTSVGYSS